MCRVNLLLTFAVFGWLCVVAVLKISLEQLITWGSDRAQALSRLSTALHEFRVGGLPNNIDFLHQAATSPQFVEGGITTKFLEDHGKEIVERSVAHIGTQENAIAAALFVLQDRRANTSNPDRKSTRLNSSHKC